MNLKKCIIFINDISFFLGVKEHPKFDYKY